MTEIYTVLDEDMAAELTQRFGDTVMEILSAGGWETEFTSRFIIGRTYRVKQVEQPSLTGVYDKIRSMNSFSNGGYGIPTLSVTEDLKQPSLMSVDDVVRLLNPFDIGDGYVTLSSQAVNAIIKVIRALESPSPEQAVGPNIDEMLRILRPLHPKVGFITITARTGAAIAELIESLINE